MPEYLLSQVSHPSFSYPKVDFFLFRWRDVSWTERGGVSGVRCDVREVFQVNLTSLCLCFGGAVSDRVAPRCARGSTEVETSTR
jgi:hypothetical protein